MSIKQRIKNLFRKKYTVTFYFKSGDRLVTKAYKLDIKKPNNELINMEYEWVDTNNYPLYIRMDDVSAITYK